jgi:prepilin-type processing-associated H-X9-DG protein
MKMNFRRNSQNRIGLTLVELLAVISVIGILAAMLLPLLQSAKAKSRAINCLSNLKQLQLAWNTYEVDTSRLAQNPINIASEWPEGKFWAQGWMNFSSRNTDNTNTLNLLDPAFALLGPYTRAAGIYKCPADRGTVNIEGRPYSRVRSYTANAGAGGMEYCNGAIGYRGPQKLEEILTPGPSNFFVFVDTHPDSIGATAFWPETPTGDWDTFPASHHAKAGNISFADGHVELHRWTDNRTQMPVRNTSYLQVVSRPNQTANPDIRWIWQRTSMYMILD